MRVTLCAKSIRHQQHHGRASVRTLTANNHDITIAYQRFGAADDPLLLIMGIGADVPKIPGVMR